MQVDDGVDTASVSIAEDAIHLGLVRSLVVQVAVELKPG